MAARESGWEHPGGEIIWRRTEGIPATTQPLPQRLTEMVEEISCHLPSISEILCMANASASYGSTEGQLGPSLEHSASELPEC